MRGHKKQQHKVQYEYDSSGDEYDKEQDKNMDFDGMNNDEIDEALLYLGVYFNIYIFFLLPFSNSR